MATKQEELDYELDNWFDEPDEVTEDLSAADDEETEEEPSASEEPEPDAPDDEALDAVSEDDTAAEATQQAPEQADDPYAWLNQLDPDLRKQAEQLVHRDKSNSGRVAALQRRLDEQAATLQAQQQATQTRRPNESVGSGQALPEDATDEQLTEFLDEYPTVAQNVQKLINKAVQDTRQEVLDQVRPLQEKAQQQAISNERHRLREYASQIFNSAETGVHLDDVTSSPAFRDWVAQQPDGYQQYAKNANRAEDAAKVLADFAAYSEWAMKNMEPEEVAEETTPDTGEATKVAARRKSALQGTTPSSKSATVDGPAGNSYEDWFDYAVDQDNR